MKSLRFLLRLGSLGGGLYLRGLPSGTLFSGLSWRGFLELDFIFVLLVFVDGAQNLGDPSTFVLCILG